MPCSAAIGQTKRIDRFLGVCCTLGLGDDATAASVVTPLGTRRAERSFLSRLLIARFHPVSVLPVFRSRHVPFLLLELVLAERETDVPGRSARL